MAQRARAKGKTTHREGIFRARNDRSGGKLLHNRIEEELPASITPVSEALKVGVAPPLIDSSCR